MESMPFDVADYLRDAEEVAAYLTEVLAENDPALIAKALGNVARSKGMAEIARKTGLGRESLYKALSEAGNPTIDTLTRVLDALGLRLSVQPARAA